jgi:hypothetical protein
VSDENVELTFHSYYKFVYMYFKTMNLFNGAVPPV